MFLFIVTQVAHGARNTLLMLASCDPSKVQKPVVKIRTSSNVSNGDAGNSRAQQRVRQQFEEIDAGRLDARSVFSQISGAAVQLGS